MTPLTPAAAGPDEPEEDLSALHPGALLYRAAALQNFPVMADALAHGADVNWVNVGEESSTPLIQAVSVVRTRWSAPLWRVEAPPPLTLSFFFRQNALAACEFLLQNGAHVNQVDSSGRGPLHHATILGHTG